MAAVGFDALREPAIEVPIADFVVPYLHPVQVLGGSIRAVHRTSRRAAPQVIGDEIGDRRSLAPVAQRLVVDGLGQGDRLAVDGRGRDRGLRVDWPRRPMPRLPGSDGTRRPRRRGRTGRLGDRVIPSALDSPASIRGCLMAPGGCSRRGVTSFPARRRAAAWTFQACIPAGIEPATCRQGMRGQISVPSGLRARGGPARTLRARWPMPASRQG